MSEPRNKNKADLSDHTDVVTKLEDKEQTAQIIQRWKDNEKNERSARTWSKQFGTFRCE